MKKIVCSVVLTILTVYILMFPREAVNAASFGLILWYTKLLPTLLPFAILSYIFVASGLLHTFTLLLHKVVKYLLPVSPEGIYPLLAGFLFGFPMGSLITSQMVEQNRLSHYEGNRLFAIANNIGPVFVSGYVLNACLQRPELRTVTFLILYAPPLVFLMMEARFLKKDLKLLPPQIKKAAPGFQINFKIIDAGIMNGFETLTKLGGYIILFSILSEMTKSLPLKSELFTCTLSGFTEITSGIAHISSSSLSFRIQYPLILAVTSFGGLSGLAQTASMVGRAGFSMKRYLATRLILSVCSGTLASLAVWLLF